MTAEVCYFVLPEYNTWDDAQAECNSQGTELVMFDMPTQADQLATYLK